MQFFISGEIIHSPPLSETDRVKTEKRLQDIYKKRKVQIRINQRLKTLKMNFIN